MTTIPTYTAGSDLPDLTITWYDQDDQLIDFSTGYTFSLKLGKPGTTATLTKTTGITGAATDPNVTIAWATSGELNTLATGTYSAQLTATRSSDSKQRIMPFELRVRPAIT